MKSSRNFFSVGEKGGCFYLIESAEKYRLQLYQWHGV